MYHLTILNLGKCATLAIVNRGHGLVVIYGGYWWIDLAIIGISSTKYEDIMGMSW